MTDQSKAEYEAAIKQLNKLFRSDRLMEKVYANRRHYSEKNVPDMWKLMNQFSISQKDVDEMNVIHVTGTKGKGSTTAFIESIIRHHGYKTLYYSSPHVKEMRERFQLDGQPLSYKTFTTYFWDVYNGLKHLVDEDNTLLHFYNFLMVMCVYIAIKEKQRGNIDAIIMEGMLGGEFDYTNFFNKKSVCGITSLALEHTSELGNTIQDIAWHKAGILRKDVPAFTVTQPIEAMKVLQERAKEKETTLSLCPSLETFGCDIELGIDGQVQKMNAALALMLAREWIQQQKGSSEAHTNGVEPNLMDVTAVSQVEREGLKNCKPLGKDHIVKLDGMTFYLDGAHTLESLQNCIEWFETKRQIELMDKNVPVQRVLVFAAAPDRTIDRLLTPLKDYPFDIVIFPAHVSHNVETSIDHMIPIPTREDRIHNAKLTKKIWDDGHQQAVTSGDQKSIFFHSIADCLKWLTDYRVGEMQAKRYWLFQILVTGGVGWVGKHIRLLSNMKGN